MDQKLYELLGQWAKVSTWHTHHPLDQRRFHHAVSSISQELGNQIDEGEFRSALRKCAKEAPATLGGNGGEEAIEHYTNRAMHIFRFLHDTGR